MQFNASPWKWCEEQGQFFVKLFTFLNSCVCVGLSLLTWESSTDFTENGLGNENAEKQGIKVKWVSDLLPISNCVGVKTTLISERKMSDLDELIRQLATNDTKKKLTVGQNIIDYLGDPESSIDCEDLSGFIDTLVPWMQSSNFKVCIRFKNPKR